MSRSKYFCYTLNNYNDQEEQALQNLSNEQVVTYHTYGREIGSENGTRHLQGYIEFSRRLRFAQVLRLLPERTHVEVRRGTSIQAAEYCWKECESPYIYGELSVPRQGQRTDLEALHESLKEKRSIKDISDDHFGSFLRYERSIKSYKFYHSKPRDPNYPPSVICYWGATETGKTRSIWENAPTYEDIWVYPGKGWFDGFEDHKIALFDDFRGSSMEVHLLLQVLDRYPLKVRIKGAHVNWNPEEIYITSNIRPEEWYPNVDQETRAALMRRFTAIFEFQ